MDDKKNRIIIVGGNHHNGLNLARIFGMHEFLVDCCVITSATDSILHHSKYTNKCLCFNNEKAAFDWIYYNYTNNIQKPFIIPYSDRAAMELDNRLEQFKHKFYVPSINDEQGRISYLMDKKNQYDWAVSNGIKMADSVEIELKKDVVQPYGYPIILKPALSAEGDKRDICICNNEEEFHKVIALLIENGYSRTVVQPYLSIDYEIDVFGCICKNEPEIFLVPTETIRAWPEKKGTNCFSKIITDNERINKCKFIIRKLKESGFYGLYDIEILVVNGEFYLNEINYRNSGDDYIGLSQMFYYPIIWVNDVLGKENKIVKEYPNKPSYAMTFNCDIRHVFSHKISVFRWIKDLFLTKDFALKFRGDMGPMWYFYWDKILKKITIRVSNKQE